MPPALAGVAPPVLLVIAAGDTVLATGCAPADAAYLDSSFSSDPFIFEGNAASRRVMVLL